MISLICKRYRIKNYTVNSDGSIDVDGNVYLDNRKLTKLPLKFNKVNGKRKWKILQVRIDNFRRI